jgi:hypothetical protein
MATQMLKPWCRLSGRDLALCSAYHGAPGEARAHRTASTGRRGDSLAEPIEIRLFHGSWRFGSTRYSTSRHMQNETCRHSAVILTMMEPQPGHAVVRESRLMVQRGMVMRSISTDPSSMLTISATGVQS